MNEVLQAVSDILREHCGVAGDIGAESLLQEDLGLDSMGLLTLALETENHFDLCLDEAPDQPPQRVGEIVDLVMRRLEEKL
jgi:acyl carrier protein